MRAIRLLIFETVPNLFQDSVRVYAVDIALALAKKLTENEIEEFIFKTVEAWAGT